MICKVKKDYVHNNIIVVFASCTVSLFLIKIAKIPQAPKSRFTQGCVLLTVHPKEIASKESGMEFHRYIPPKR